jgi:hypothetical protein
MAKEEFPRFRNRDFSYRGSFKIPYYRGGRLDLECAEKYDTPTAYKVFAAANRMMNPMITRPTLRPTDQMVRNELVLRGLRGRELEDEIKRINDIAIRGVRDWLGYTDFGNGNITDAEPERTVFVPSPETAVNWYDEYNELKEIPNSEDT